MFLFVIVGALGVVALVTAVVVAGAIRPDTPRDRSVTMCQHTGSATSPYVAVAMDADAVVEHFSPGPVPGTAAGGPDRADIIPPFDFGPGARFAGLNWDDEGRALYASYCVNDDLPVPLTNGVGMLAIAVGLGAAGAVPLLVRRRVGRPAR